MKASLSIVLVSALVLAACGRERHAGRGEVLALDAGAVTIAHEEIPGIAPAKTTRLPARPPSLLAGLAPGTRVRFEVERDGEAVTLVGVERVGEAAGEPARHLHDHRPGHGGVAAIMGPMLVEIVADATGSLRVWLTDHERAAIPVAGTTGTVRMDLPDGRRTLELVPAGDVLEARTTPFGTESAVADVTLVRDGRTHEARVLLDLGGKRAGVAGVPEAGCVAPDRGAQRGPTPRCTIAFGRAFTALGAAAPDGARVAVALSHGETSVWSVPAGRVVMGLDPAPPLPILPGQHEPAVRVIAARPDGAELAVVLRERIDFFDAATGRHRRSIASPGGAVQSLAWLPGGTRLLVASAGDGDARVVEAADARVVRTLAVDGQGTAVAASAGRWLAAGTDVGRVALADATSDAPPRVLAPSLQAIAALGFAGERLVVAGADGTLRVVDAASGAESARVDVGAPILLLAVASDGLLAATADAERTIRVHRLPDGAVVATRAWHRATVSGLAFGPGGALVSGDNDGELAMWDPEAVAPR